MSVASGRLWLMDTYTYIAAAGSLVLGLALGVLIGQRRKGSGSPVDSLQLEKDLAAANATVLGLSAQVAEAARERKERDDREKEALAEQNRIIREMAPLIENVSKMETKVSEMERERLEQFSDLKNQLKDNREQQGKLLDNTSALQNALTNNQNRGKWGELNLKRLLEQSGLVAGIHFEEQKILENEDGKTIKPDFIVNYPDGKFVAIDVKFPFANFERAMKIPEVASSDDEKARKANMKAHIDDVKKHINDISSKAYFSGLKASPEFTILFVPNEGVLASTLDADQGLLDYAFERQVALVSPVSLFSVLRTIQYGWRQAAQEETMKDVIGLGVTLHKYVRTVAEHASSLGGYLNKAVASYNSFASSLERNLLTTTRRLNDKSMGILDGGKAIPTVPELSEGTDVFTKAELTEGDADEPKALN